MRTTQIKMNWFPVLVPPSISVLAKQADDRSDYEQFQNVRQYRVDGHWLAVVVGAGTVPEDFTAMSTNTQDMPRMVSTLISEAFLEHHREQGYQIDHGKGESYLYRARQLDGIPDSIKFFDGLRVKPYSVGDGSGTTFGLVLDYSTHQEFVRSLGDDKTQEELAKHGCQAIGCTADGRRVSGFVAKLDGSNVLLRSRGQELQVSAYSLRVQANYEEIQMYLDRSDRPGRGREIVRQLMIASLTLTASGYRNLNQLADRYKRVADILGRDKNANINIRLGTVCQSLASVATEPVDLEIKP